MKKASYRLCQSSWNGSKLYVMIVDSCETLGGSSLWKEERFEERSLLKLLIVGMARVKERKKMCTTVP